MTGWRSRLFGVALAAVVATAAARAAAPERPTVGHGNSIYVFAGSEYLDFDLDPRSSPEFVAADLDPRLERAGFLVGVGWTFARPLRLDLSVGAWEAEIDRPDVDCTVARVIADLHLLLAESRSAALEATFTVGSPVLVYEGLPEDETLLGGEAGIGLTGRVSLAGPVGLMVGYRYQHVEFARGTFEMPEEPAIMVHPTARFQSVRIVVTVDL